MHDYPALEALAEIIRRGSFEAAAARLGVTPSAVSQRIKGLEEKLGVVLIRRGTPATGTAAGLRLMQHLDQVRLLEASLDAGICPGGQPPVVRIAINADSLATWFLPAMTALPALYDLIVDDQDHARDWLEQGTVSAAITSDPQPVPGCDVTALGRMRYLALASPDFTARYFPRGVTTAALEAAPTVFFNRKDALQTHWAERVSGGRPRLSGHYIPASEPFARALTFGLGWGMVPEGMARAEVLAGRLQPLDDSLPLDVPLYWQVARTMKAALHKLTSAVKEKAAAELRP